MEKLSRRLREDERSRRPSGRRGDEPARGHDDQMAVLPLDRLDPAEARKHATAGDVEDAAAAGSNPAGPSQGVLLRPEPTDFSELCPLAISYSAAAPVRRSSHLLR